MTSFSRPRTGGTASRPKGIIKQLSQLLSSYFKQSYDETPIMNSPR